MKRFVFTLAAVALLGWVTPVQANGITYTFNQSVGPGSVTGTIETDGITGTLAFADILGWNLTLNDGYGDVSNLIPSNSLLSPNSFAGDLTASLTALMFDFNGNGGILAIEGYT